MNIYIYILNRDLRNNKLKGSIPEELKYLTNLKYL